MSVKQLDMSRRWWKHNGEDNGIFGADELYDSLFSEVDRVDEETVDRQQRLIDASALYGDEGSQVTFNGLSRNVFFEDYISHNVIATAVDALVAEITQSEIRPMAISIGGDYDQRKKAEKLTQYFDAKWRTQRVHDLLRHCVRDAVIMGMGVVRVGRLNELDAKNDDTFVERIYPGDLLMDDRGRDTMPRQFYIRRFVERAHLGDMFPAKRDLIEMAVNKDTVFYAYPERVNDWVEVIEAIHMESKPGAKDGRRVMAIRNTLLVDERGLKKTDVPYVFMRGVMPTRGFWGGQLVLRAASAQKELNKLLTRVQEAMHLHAVPRVFVQRQAGIVDTHLNNDIGVIIEYDGEPPKWYTPSSMSGDVYQHIDRLEQWIYKELGVSELSATSQRVIGLESAPAYRAYNDVQTRRWINFVRESERWAEDVAYQLVMREGSISKDYPARRVSLAEGRKVTNYKWSEMGIDPDAFSVAVYSASALPNTPAGKLQALEEMVKTGIIDQKQFIKLADIPDLESVRKLVMAGEELVELELNRMLTEEDYQAAPEPGMDYAKVRQKAQQMAWQAKIEEAPWERIQKLLEFIEATKALEEIEAMKMMEAQLDMQMQAQANVAPGEGLPVEGDLAASPMPGGGSGLTSQAMVLPSQPAPPPPGAVIPEG